MGQPAALIFTPEDRAAGAPEAELATARRDGKSPDIRWHLRKDGTRFFVDGVTSALHNPAGDVIGFGKVLIDITPRKQIADASEWQASLLDLSHDAVLAWDFTSEGILYWNQAAQQLYQYAVDEAIGRGSHALLKTVFPIGVAQVKTSLSRTGRWEGILIHTTKDGRQIQVESRMVLRQDKAGQPIVLEANRDVTSERRAQERIAQSEERFRSLANSIPQIVWIVDDQGRAVFFNRQWTIYTGISISSMMFSEVAGRFVHPDDQGVTAQTWQKALQNQKIFTVEHRVRSATGEYRWFLVRGEPVFDSATGKLAQWFGTSTDIHEHKQAQANLLESAERVRLAADAAQLGIWSWDAANDKAVWENDRMYDLIGISKTDEPVNTERFLADIIHPDDVKPYQQAMAKTLETGERFYHEGRFYRASDRALRWFEFTGLLHRDANGKPLRMVGTATDVTERKENEEQVRIANARLKATLNANEIGTWLFDLQADKVYADTNMARLYGVSAADADGGPAMAYFNVLHPEDVENVKAVLERSMATGELFQNTYRVRRPEGGYRTINVRGRIEFDNAGKPAWLTGVALDITQQKEAEEALRSSEERFRTLITSMDEGFCLLQMLSDDNGHPTDFRYLETNPAFERQTGLANVIGKTLSEVVPGIERHWISTHGKVAMTGEPLRFVEQVAALERWFDVYSTPTGKPQDRQVAILFKDITAQKKTEENLRQLAADLSEANRRKTEFLATLAHELRNPLAPIRTGLELMRLGQDSAATVTRVREMMERQVDHLVHLINDLLDIARINSGKVDLKKTAVTVKSVVASAVEASLPQIEANCHELKIDVPEEPLWLHADANRMVQVLGNLLTNGAKYTPEGGRITVSAAQEGAEVTIAVSDTGIGIPVESLPRVFDMFSQVDRNMPHSQGGLGIGLALVQRLIELHGGSVTAFSAGPDQGSTFTVRLPVQQASPQSNDSGHLHLVGKRSPDKRQLRILIADDNKDAAYTLSELLQAVGHLTQIAHDGHHAVAMAKPFRPDVALLDIGMPGMNGYEVARVLRSEPMLQTLTLVALTGWGAPEDRASSREAGFNHHVTKPVDIELLQRLLDQSAGATQTRAGLG